MSLISRSGYGGKASAAKLQLAIIAEVGKYEQGIHKTQADGIQRENLKYP